MIHFRAVYACFLARLREFYRDKASLYWHLFLPCFIILAFYFIFGKGEHPVYKVGVAGGLSQELKEKESFFQLKYVQFIPQSEEEGRHKVQYHKLDMLVQTAEPPLKYWTNPSSKNGYFVERLLKGHYQGRIEKHSIAGKPISYVEWVFPGIIALNLLFGCLWGVGWTIVKYRDEGYLKRLYASPLKVHQFILGQTLARLVIVSVVTSFLLVIGSLLIGFKIQGSFLDLAVCYFFGALALTAIGLLVSTRTTSKEFADGVLNVFSWPMILFSGMWFSMEGAVDWMKYVSYAFPLTHLIESTRRIMLEGVGLFQVWPHIGAMMLFSLILYIIIFSIFKWNEK